MQIAVRAGDFVAVGVEVIDVAPVDFAVLRGEAVGVDGCVESPGMNFFERKILVDEADLVFVAVERGGKEGLVHAGAVGALEVVKVDDGDLGGGVAADGAVGDVDVRAGFFGEVEGVEAGRASCCRRR